MSTDAAGNFAARRLRKSTADRRVRPVNDLPDFHWESPKRDESDDCKILDAMFRIDGRYRLIVTRDGTIIQHSLRAHEALSDKHCFDLRDGRLRPSRECDNAAFTKLLMVRGEEVVSIVIPRQRHGDHCILQGAAIDGERICIAVILSTDGHQPELPDLTTLFGLTQSETGIVESIFGGSTPAQIAESLGISIHTVRAHLRQSYAKLGVSSREELWGKLHIFRMN